MEQRLLLLCKDKISKIIKIFSEQTHEDVTEFQTTVQMVQVVVNRLLNGKKQITIDVPLLDRINVILGEYLGILEQFVQSGRLKRLFQSNRIRRRLEKINSDLHAQLKQFVESLKKLNSSVEGGSVDVPSPEPLKKRDSKKDKKPKKSNSIKKTKEKKTKPKKEKKGSKRDPKKTSIEHKKPEKTVTDEKNKEPEKPKLYSTMPQHKEDQPNTPEKVKENGEKEEPTKQSNEEDDRLDIIQDVEGKAMWAKVFGEQNFYVEWDKFLAQLSQVLKTEISADDATLLKHVLDNSGTGHVNMYKWSEFLKGFGPLPNIIKNVQDILFAPWFHGFLSSTEAKLLLEEQPVGTFLIRFSRSSGGSFALAFVQEPKKVLHILIQSCQPDGYRIEEEEDTEAKIFRSLPEVVDHYRMHLINPFTSDLPRESWFHGDVSADEAGELLEGAKDGTFLIRFSSKPGCFAATYVDKGVVKHALVQAVEGGYLFAGEKELFPNLRALIGAYSSTLSIPLPNVENNVAPVLRKYWAAKALEKKDQPTLSRDTHYESVRNHTDKGN